MKPVQFIITFIIELYIRDIKKAIFYEITKIINVASFNLSMLCKYFAILELASYWMKVSLTA